MARERGAFEHYDLIREKENPFMNRLFAEEGQLKKDMTSFGRRNIACLTIAPTGSTSLMSQTTSGLEPVFKVSYKRRRKVNPNDKEVRVDFVDKTGDAWEEFHVFHHKFKDWLALNGHDPERVAQLDDGFLNKLIEQSPYHQSTANDIDWVKKVEMQGMVQKWVDHSISVTVNIPNNTPVETIRDIYMTAWKHGCKGMTIYRDGSRDGVLISNDTKNEVRISESTAPKRPKKLEASVIRFNKNDEKWIWVVGLLDGQPYEIFTGKAEDSFLLPPERGWIIKSKNGEGKNRYDFEYQDRDGYKVTIQGLNRSFNPEFCQADFRYSTSRYATCLHRQHHRQSSFECRFFKYVEKRSKESFVQVYT